MKIRKEMKIRKGKMSKKKKNNENEGWEGKKM